jgi:ribose transport system permease protein
MTGLPSAPIKTAGGRRGPAVEDLLSRYGLILALLVLIALFTALRPTTFFTFTNLAINLNTKAVLVLLVLATLPALSAGLYDMSVAGAMGISYVLMGYLNIVLGWPIGIAISAALFAGLAIGLVNAALIVGVGINSLIATLGMGTLLSGMALGINGSTVSGLTAEFVGFFRFSMGGIQMVFAIALIATIVLWYVFGHTPFGRYLFIVGAGPDVARLSGLRVKSIQTSALLIASLGAAFAGIALAGTQNSVDPNSASKLLLPAFSAAFLGSTAIVPGRFNAWGAFTAVYFLATGITGLQFLGLSGWIENVFYGASLVVAVLLSFIARKRISTT